MGSKIGMLAGVLGEEIREIAPRGRRFVDLFAGSGAVAKYVASTVDMPVTAVDLLQFSRIMSAATLERTRLVDGERLAHRWAADAARWLREHQGIADAASRLSAPTNEDEVANARRLCATRIDNSFIWSHYGGYYFSPAQALSLSAFYATLPRRAPHRTIAYAALLRTASRASASPGHTAQPFRPTERLLPHLRSAWRIDIANEIERQVKALSAVAARQLGMSITADSVQYAQTRLRAGDVVFCDPPYSEAQYSRFYHVLEGIAVGGWDSVHGAGRAPLGTERPSSDFSRRTRAVQATVDLITALGEKKCTVLWTYPEGERSNALTVDHIRDAATTQFDVTESRIPMRHSTLGGSKENHEHRHGRKDLHEILFRFEPKRTSRTVSLTTEGAPSARKRAIA